MTKRQPRTDAGKPRDPAIERKMAKLRDALRATIKQQEREACRAGKGRKP